MPDLALYLHVPFCKHACPYCDFYKMELRERPARARLEFPGLLAREHEILMKGGGIASRPLASIYFGGGTPSTLQPKGVGELVGRLRDRHSAGCAEVTLEANPENLRPARCEAWRAAGITRLSIGVQSFHARDLARLERLHDPAAIPRAVANARAAGFGNLSLDLMFGLPGQTLGEWRENLERAAELQPEHLSFYGLTVHEETPFSREHAEGRLREVDEGLFADMYLAGAEFLERRGFEHYEISNFARPGCRSVHNQRYWTGGDVLGLGPGAHSSLGAARWFNAPDIDRWSEAVRDGRIPHEPPEVLDETAALEESLFRRLRRCEGFEAQGGGERDEGGGQRHAGGRWTADAVFFEWLNTPAGETARSEGWVKVANGGARARLTRLGWLLSDALLVELARFAEKGA